MRKLSAKWVPKCLNVDQKRKRCQSSERVWNFSARSKWFPAAIGDHGKSLVISLWPDTKQQSTEWRHSGSSRLKYPSAKITEKFLVSILWDQNGILHIYYLPKGHTINAEYYLSHLVQVKDILKEKRRPRVGHQGGSCSCTAMPRLTGHLKARRNWPTGAISWSPTLFSASGPLGLPTVSWTEKTIEISPRFVRRGGDYCRGDLVGRTAFWFFF